MSENSTEEAIKLVNLVEDFEEDEEEEQSMFRTEVIAHNMINKIDTKGHYFTKFFFCAEFTAEKIALNQESTTKNKRYVNSTNKASFLYYTEKMNTDFFKYAKNARANKIKMFPILERVKLGIHLLQGIFLINDKIEHCDIKPENIMLKKISAEEAQQYISEGVYVASLGNDFYVAKFIDFGMVQFKKSNQAVSCPGGTRGYLGQEYFSGGDNNGIDKFALGMNLVDLEMAAHGLGMASDVLAQSHDMRLRKVGAFTQRIRQTVGSMSSGKAILLAIDQVGVQDQIRDAAIKVLPTLSQHFSSQGKTKKDFKNQNIAFMNIKLFEFMVSRGLEVMPTYPVFNKYYDEDIAGVQNKINNLKGDESEEKKSTLLKLNIGLQVAMMNKELSIAYWNMLMKMIDVPESRPDYDTLIHDLEELIASHENALLELNGQMNIGVDQIKKISSSVVNSRAFEGTLINRDENRQVVMKDNNGLEVMQSQKFLI